MHPRKLALLDNAISVYPNNSEQLKQIRNKSVVHLSGVKRREFSKKMVGGIVLGCFS